MDPQLWDGNFNLVFLFRINKFLASNAKNIACSLQRIVTFISQRPLNDKDSNDIS